MILVDTKYEMGRLPDGRIALIDEVHTPDSSRFWVAESYEDRLAAGEEPDNFDKEFLRLWYAERGYRGDGEPPQATEDLIAQVSRRYIACYERLTGQTFEPGAYPVEERLQGLKILSHLSLRGAGGAEAISTVRTRALGIASAAKQHVRPGRRPVDRIVLVLLAAWVLKAGLAPTHLRPIVWSGLVSCFYRIPTQYTDRPQKRL